MLKGGENKTAKEKQNNQKLVKKIIKTVYLIARKKWAVKNNYTDALQFLVDIGDQQISLHLQQAPFNKTYASTMSAENFLKVIGNFLNDKVIRDILEAGEFTVLSNESTDEGESSRKSVYVRFVDAQTHKPVEHFLGMVPLTTYKKAAD